MCSNGLPSNFADVLHNNVGYYSKYYVQANASAKPTGQSIVSYGLLRLLLGASYRRHYSDTSMYVDYWQILT